eukprot:m.66957 g.66957  ORF g.66957 m.66957 type:complete len:341 (-) comp12154_c0_seq1:621-1643(-)
MLHTARYRLCTLAVPASRHVSSLIQAPVARHLVPNLSQSPVKTLQWLTRSNQASLRRFTTAACRCQHTTNSDAASPPPSSSETASQVFDSNTQSWEDQRKIPMKELPNTYSRLTKLRLSGLVVLTMMNGYALAPVPFDWATFGVASLGTALCVASANSFNQWIEVPYDSQMSRTMARPLVKGEMSPFHAFSVGVTTGALGVGILATMVNPLVAALGFGNILLYAGAYTPMKRLSIYNTWVGSLVGAIPPLMGWATGTGTLDPAAFVLAGILFAWQFPHFNALSWKLRPDYSKVQSYSRAGFLYLWHFNSSFQPNSLSLCTEYVHIQSLTCLGWLPHDVSY